jgi:arylsulfatase A-like enzyme
MKHFYTFFFSLIITGFVWAKKPNIVFMVSEDNSVHYLKHYGAKFGSMPNVEKMASQGLTFNHAFSNGPVCSVARSTLALGVWGPRMGIQYHRKAEAVTLPKGVLPWSAILRNAGYYCANNSKQDYNFIIKGINAWDQSSKKASWRNRPNKDTPFFYMQSMAQSHEGSLHFSNKVMEDEKPRTPVGEVDLHPYHPDTRTFRYTHARYYDRIEMIDELIGGVLKKLDYDGLLEDTFVFYFGDHGGVLPRGKGYAYESGLHVPLVVRIPQNFKNLVDFQRGTRMDGFVSFIDFGPTILNLAGIKVDKRLDGKVFMGRGISAEEVESRDETFGYADRFDEKYDFVRTYRKGKWKYIRNYQGFYPDGLQNNYRYRMLAFQEWRELFKKGKLTDEQSQFFKARSAEQLFDLSQDPHEVNDLSGHSDKQDILLELRGKLHRKVKSINDLSFYPESHMVDHALQNPLAFGQDHSEEITKLVDVADLALLSFQKAKPKLVKVFQNGTDWEKYWACLVCSQFEQDAKSLSSHLKKMLSSKNLMLRMRAIEALALTEKIDPIPSLIDVANVSESSVEVLLILNTVTFFRDHHGFELNPKLLKIIAPKAEYYRRIEYFSQN